MHTLFDVSQVVIANAYHHRSDAASSLVALFGIGGAMMGFPWLDPFAGLVCLRFCFALLCVFFNGGFAFWVGSSLVF